MKLETKRTQSGWVRLIITGLSLTCGASAYAGAGGSGGGDQCRNEIDKDRLAILGWIQRDEAKDLNFGLAQVSGWTYDDPAPAKSYKKSMLSVLQEGKVIVTCYLDPARISDSAAQKIATAEGVSYKAVTIGSPPVPTTCINYEDANKVSHIDCNYDLVMASSSVGNPDYVTTHHEFASIAGIEERKNTFASDFSISNQLSQYEHLKTVRLLGPKACGVGHACDAKLTSMSYMEAGNYYNLGTIPSIQQLDDQLSGTWIELGSAAYIADYDASFDPTGLKNQDGSSRQLQFCKPATGDLAANFLNMNQLNENGGPISVGLAFDGDKPQFNGIDFFIPQIAGDFARCRFISTDENQMVCAVFDRQAYKFPFPVDYLYFVRN